MKKKIGENRIYIIFAIIIVICAGVILAVLIKNFFGTGADKYGDRLDGIDKVKISEEKQKEIEEKLEEKDKISDVGVSIYGKIIYISFKFEDGISLAEAKTQAVSSLDEFSEEEKAFYDFQFSLKQDKTEKNDGFNIMGAKNVNGTKVAWVNNNSAQAEEKEEKK